MARKHGAHSETWSIVPVGIAAIYGGYFGAALGVILLAVLVVFIDDSLIRLNALKQLVSLAVNVSAAVAFLFLGESIGQSHWSWQSLRWSAVRSAARSPLAFPQNSSAGS
jgi:uncharacterized membrane protein YfcA